MGMEVAIPEDAVYFKMKASILWGLISREFEWKLKEKGE